MGGHKSVETADPSIWCGSVSFCSATFRLEELAVERKRTSRKKPLAVFENGTRIYAPTEPYSKFRIVSYDPSGRRIYKPAVMPRDDALDVHRTTRPRTLPEALTRWSTLPHPSLSVANRLSPRTTTRDLREVQCPRYDRATRSRYDLPQYGWATPASPISRSYESRGAVASAV